MICSQWDVVSVPFPFTDKPDAKRRPALVLSNTAFNRNGHTVLTMITTKGHLPWPGDSEIEEYSAAGLNLQCRVRFKIFTLDNRLLLKKIGRLSENDSKKVKKHLHHYFS
ncbi:MAG: mRNA interferase MazF [Desulfobacteraceae bacterium Eth-SRB2]|nr:MAG: mRNA interferase MazF [Desulfobacteraceae bacterium Eth-SRB2]